MRVGVIIPLHQSGATVAETIGSLRAQTHDDWRCVVVDDGSTDAGPWIVRRIIEDDPRISMVSQPNRGLWGARNRGLDELDALDAAHGAEAGGRYVHFLDADDLVLRSAYERMVGVLERTDADGVCVGYELRDECGDPIGRPLTPPAMGVTIEELRRGNRMVPHSQMLRRGVLGAARFVESRCEDYDLWVRLAEQGVRWRAIDAVLVAYRLRQGSISKRSREMLEAHVAVLSRTHRRGLGRNEIGCGGDDLRIALDSLTLNYATMAALMDVPSPSGALAEGVSILRDHVPNASFAPDAIGRTIYWATLFGRCQDPTDGSLDWTPAARAWIDALGREGFIDGAPSDPQGVRAEVGGGIARQAIDPTRIGARLLDGLTFGSTVALVGYGANGRVVASIARERGLRVVICDDRARRVRGAVDDADAPIIVDPRIVLEQRGAWDRVGITPEGDGRLRVRFATVPRLVTWNDVARELGEADAPWRGALVDEAGGAGLGAA